MKYITLLLVCIVSQSLSAQDTATYEKVTKAFQENFNSMNIDGVFKLYTNELQEDMTIEGVERFINGCHTQFGNLKKLVFIESTEGVNRYTATFDKINLIMEIKLSTEGQISSVQFQEP